MDWLIEAVNATEVNVWSSVYKLLLSLAFGAMVGYERKRKGQTAGVRTFSLIAMGATLAMILSIYVPQEYLGLKNGDPGRIAAQVVTGVGFLGAGAIIQMRGSVRGLTTAAGIWMIAAIGMAVGVGMYWISFIATLLILFILVQLEKFEHHINLGAESRIIKICMNGITPDIEPYRHVIDDNKGVLTHYYLEYDYAGAGSTTINLVVRLRDNVDYAALFAKLRDVEPGSTRSITLSNS